MKTQTILDVIASFGNPRRLRSSLQHLCPLEFEIQTNRLLHHMNSASVSLRQPLVSIKPARGFPLSASLLCAALCLLVSSTSAATNDLTTAIQRGLFEEEANQNLGAAIQAYQTVANQFDKDRKLAAKIGRAHV